MPGLRRLRVPALLPDLHRGFDFRSGEFFEYYAENLRRQLTLGELRRGLYLSVGTDDLSIDPVVSDRLHAQRRNLRDGVHSARDHDLSRRPGLRKGRRNGLHLLLVGNV